MSRIIIYLLYILIITIFHNGHAFKKTNGKFPNSFKFGVATSAYQIEGAWNVSGKGPSIWDHMVHTNPSFIVDRSSGDIACDSYHKTDEDVKLLKELGVDFYRFSLSWSRLLPNGFVNQVNPDGVRYYNKLIDALIANGIKPMVTIFHFDTPQNLHELGGWPNPKLADLFTDYARLVFSLFGDRVKDWFTFNEPMQTCHLGYALGILSPGYTSKEMANYFCAHTLLLAHGQSYRLYEKHFKKQQGGRIGIAIDHVWAEPKTKSNEDIEAAERFNLMYFGWYAHPIFSKNGDYPPIFRERVDKFSKEEGFPRSKLPYFTKQEIDMLKGSADFLGLNHYTTRLVSNSNNITLRPSYDYDRGIKEEIDPSWPIAAADWLAVVPWGLRKSLEWIKSHFDNPKVYITENGYAEFENASLWDCERVGYYNMYLEELLKAIHESGCNVIGYTAWSFMDNFEWINGYTQRFGLFHVDFNNPGRTRTAKLSAHIYANIIKSRQIDWDFVPEMFPPCQW